MQWKNTFNQDPRLAGFYRQVAGRPSWPTRAGLLSAALIVVIPVLLILIAGIAVGLIVYFVASVLANIGDVLTGNTNRNASESAEGFAGDDMRENVRVVQRP